MTFWHPDLDSNGAHAIHVEVCVIDRTAYCTACIKGCPKCGCGASTDRRSSVRTPLETEVHLAPSGI